eukprot:GHVQ01036278.1.p2 GENE.GHVQ01036278.1~~GHVQ01036278.1.p2  ORF type:complete len:651 (+),score=96.35 GHVQ01036278.1:786-2738(+)
MEKKSEVVESTRRCKFYLTTKQRYCKFLPSSPGSDLCSVHSVDRVCCPLAPNHTVSRVNLCKHALVCTYTRDLAYSLSLPFHKTLPSLLDIDNDAHSCTDKLIRACTTVCKEELSLSSSNTSFPVTRLLRAYKRSCDYLSETLNPVCPLHFLQGALVSNTCSTPTETRSPTASPTTADICDHSTTLPTSSSPPSLTYLPTCNECKLNEQALSSAICLAAACTSHKRSFNQMTPSSSSHLESAPCALAADTKRVCCPLLVSNGDLSPPPSSPESKTMSASPPHNPNTSFSERIEVGKLSLSEQLPCLCDALHTKRHKKTKQDKVPDKQLCEGWHMCRDDDGVVDVCGCGDCINGLGKHEKQCAGLLGHIIRRGWIPSDNAGLVVEFGAGKAGLTRWLLMARKAQHAMGKARSCVTQPGTYTDKSEHACQNVRCVIVERESRRNRKEAKNEKMVASVSSAPASSGLAPSSSGISSMEQRLIRLRLDIADFDLPALLSYANHKQADIDNPVEHLADCQKGMSCHSATTEPALLPLGLLPQLSKSWAELAERRILMLPPGLSRVKDVCGKGGNQSELQSIKVFGDLWKFLLKRGTGGGTDMKRLPRGTRRPKYICCSVLALQSCCCAVAALKHSYCSAVSCNSLCCACCMQCAG